MSGRKQFSAEDYEFVDMWASDDDVYVLSNNSLFILDQGELKVLHQGNSYTCMTGRHFPRVSN